MYKCGWKIPTYDKEDNHYGTDNCDKPAVATVVLGGITGKGSVHVCPQHKAEHDRRAASARKTRS